jgi:hypothetical protein
MGDDSIKVVFRFRGETNDDDVDFIVLNYLKVK